MNINELFEEFLTHCNNYEIISGNIVIKNGGNTFTLYKQTDLNKNYLIYESHIDGAIQAISTDNLDEIIEGAIYTVGNDMIKTKSKN